MRGVLGGLPLSLFLSLCIFALQGQNVEQVYTCHACITQRMHKCLIIVTQWRGPVTHTHTHAHTHTADVSDEVLRQLLRATGGDVQLAIEAFFDHDHAEGNGFIFVGEAGSDHLRRGGDAGVAVPPAPEPARRCVLFCAWMWIYTHTHTHTHTHSYIHTHTQLTQAYIHTHTRVRVVCVCIGAHVVDSDSRTTRLDLANLLKT